MLSTAFLYTPWVVPIFQRASQIRSKHDSRMHEPVGQTRRGTVTNAKSNHVQSQVNAEIRKCFKNTTTTTHESTRRLDKLAHTREDRKLTLSMCSLEAQISKVVRLRRREPRRSCFAQLVLALIESILMLIFLHQHQLLSVVIHLSIEK